MRRSNLIILLLALAMGTVAALMARSWIAQHSAPPSTAATGTMVVATAALPFGTVLTPDNVAEIATSGQLPEGAFATKTDLLKDGRRVVLSAMERSEMIVKPKITAPGQRASLSVLLEEGQRAVTVRVDDIRGVAGFILPGDRVDVVLLRSETQKGERENSADVLVQYVKVLAIDQLVNERQDQQPAVATVAKAVTLQVSPNQAQKILLAGNIGKLSLVLRQPEARSAEAGRVTDDDLPGALKREAAAKPAPAPEKVPTILEAFKSNTVAVTIYHGTDAKKYDVVREANETSQARLAKQAKQ